MAQPGRLVRAVPLKKGEDGADVRPVLIREALINFPGTCLLRIVESKAGRLLKPAQFGVRTPAAAETMIRLTRTLAQLCPHEVFAALDISNAFGVWFLNHSATTQYHGDARASHL